MGFKPLLMLACALVLSAFVKADIEVSLVDSVPGFNDASNRLLAEAGSITTCRFFLLNAQMMNNPSNPNFRTVYLRVTGPPFEGAVDNLNFPEKDVSFTHDLVRIIYDGDNCDCTLTIYQKEENRGRSKDYVSTGQIGRHNIDPCWARKAESLSIKCNI